jgi:trimeric autotransporter adhesin
MRITWLSLMACVCVSGCAVGASPDVTEGQPSQRPSGGLTFSNGARYTVGGSVGGLLRPGLVLNNNGGDDLSVDRDGQFVFGATVPSGATYSVTVGNPPPGESCLVSFGQGASTSDVSAIDVTCSPFSYAIGGEISGLEGTVVLQNANGDDVVVTSSGKFTFPTEMPSGAMTNVTVLTQPAAPHQRCEVSNGAMPVVASDVAIQVTCTTNKYSVSAAAAGLMSSGLVLQLGDTNPEYLPVAADGIHTFTTQVTDEQPYTMRVAVQPSNPPQLCAAVQLPPIDGNDVVIGVLCH